MNNRIIDRKPIFDVVRVMLGRGFSQSEVEAIDRAIDRALRPLQEERPPDRPLGKLSEQFESGGRGPGTVSSGFGDPGGVSYGTYQLASRTGTAAAFVRTEGAAWADELGRHEPGTPGFSAAWKAIAAREPDRFARAQHAFIRRTHYDPAVASVLARTALDIDCCHPAVCDAVWSVAVQHGGAAGVLCAAVRAADSMCARDDPGYDRALVEAIYAERTDYVLRVAQRSSAGARRTLQSIVRNRYPVELRQALAMFAGDAIDGRPVRSPVATA